jgi:hypothetical protein
VNAVERPHDRSGELLHRGCATDVDTEGPNVTSSVAQAFRLGGRGRQVEISNCDLHAFGDKCFGDRQADTARGAGDHSYLAVKDFHTCRLRTDL